MTTADLARFLESMASPGSRDALARYDMDAFGRLSPAEANTAVCACLDRICSGANDPRAVAVLDAAFRLDAEPALREALPRLPGNETKAAILRFLLALRQRPADFMAMRQLALRGQLGGQLCALEALARTDFLHEEAEATLVEATADLNENVRFQAAMHLIRGHGLQAAERTPPSPVASVGPLLLSPIQAVQVEGTRLLAAAIASPNSPPAAGFSPTESRDVGAFFDALEDEARPLGPPLAALRGRSQAWAEEQLLARVHEDPRAVCVLLAHTPDRARAALRELAGGDHDTSSEATAALAQHSADASPPGAPGCQS